MSTLPHDPTDLMLAPVAIDIDARLDLLSHFSVERVALERDTRTGQRRFERTDC